MEIIAACMLGFISGAVVTICAVYFCRSTKPAEPQRPMEDMPTEKWQEQFENMLNYNGRDNGGV